MSSIDEEDSKLIRVDPTEKENTEDEDIAKSKFLDTTNRELNDEKVVVKEEKKKKGFFLTRWGGEVLNKYYPPNFDPKKIPRIRKPKNKQKKIRSMLPFHIRCNTCGNYISRGTKFNSREEEVIDETYLGLKLHRFYFKCTNCCAELILKTDPQNLDYVVESGATRLNDQHKDEKQVEENVSAMSSLEKRSLVSKREIEVMAALDEMKSRRMSVSVDSMLEALSRRDQEEEEETKEEEALLIKSIRFGEQKRIATEEINAKLPTRRDCGKSSIKISSVRVITSKKKKTSMGLASLCQNYGSDEED